jgi:hypothetical protein
MTGALAGRHAALFTAPSFHDNRCRRGTSGAAVRIAAKPQQNEHHEQFLVA